MPIVTTDIMLRAGETHLCESSDAAYRIRAGRVEACLVPLRGKYGVHGPQRLREAEAGDVLPSLCYRDSDYQEWRLGFTALEDVALVRMEESSTSPLRTRFLASIGIEDDANQGFADSLVDHYLEAYVKGVIYIAHSDKDTRETEEETRRLVDAPLGRASTAGIPESAAWRDVVRYCLRDVDVKDAVFAIVLAGISAALLLLLPGFARELYDTLLPMGDSAWLVGVAVAVAAAMLANIAVSAVRSAIARRFAVGARRGVQNRFYRVMFRLPQRFVHARGSVEVVREVGEIGRLAGNVATALVSMGMGSVLALVVTCQMAVYSAPIAAGIVALAALGGAFAYRLSASRHRFESRAGRQASRASSLMYQILAAIEKVRAAGFESRAINMFTKRSVERRESDAAARRLAALEDTASLACSGAALLMLCVAAYVVAASPGEFAAFTLLSGVLCGAMREVGLGAARFGRLQMSFSAHSKLVDAGECAAVVPGGQPVEHLAGAIDVEHVTFAYNEGDHPVLDGITLHIEPGQRIGIAGASGCGKSTLLKLLMGLEQPDAGRIRFDGRDVSELDLGMLRKRLGVVLQDGSLIPGSIYENVALSAPGIGEAAVDRAVRAAGLQADIALLPMGLATLVGERGKLLSGGQRQRILLARALVRDPDILLLDEATSALDAPAQASAMDVLAQRKCTQLIVAHRLGTLAQCDRIIVLDGGRVVQDGAYDELMRQDGPFKRLAGSVD